MQTIETAIGTPLQLDYKMGGALRDKVLQYNQPIMSQIIHLATLAPPCCVIAFRIEIRVTD